MDHHLVQVFLFFIYCFQKNGRALRLETCYKCVLLNHIQLWVIHIVFQWYVIYLGALLVNVWCKLVNLRCDDAAAL